jgi:aminotransferase
VGAAAPLQAAGAAALHFPESYYTHLATDYKQKRDRMLGVLGGAGFKCFKPRGAYYIITDVSGFGFSDDVTFTRHLIENIGVAGVPGSSFYRNPADGLQQVRFTFCKTEKTVAAAEERLAKLKR